MRLSLLWVGRNRDRNIGAAIREYVGRIGRYLPVDVIEVKEESASHRHAEAEALLKEGRRLRERIPQSTEVVVLDVGGRQMTSQEFASYLGERINRSSSSMKGLTFVVGGPRGLDGETRKIADRVISLSRMTLTHEMARLVALEQIYRGLSILRGEKYHRP